MVEHQPSKLSVAGSSLAFRSKEHAALMEFGIHAGFRHRIFGVQLSGAVPKKKSEIGSLVDHRFWEPAKGFRFSHLRPYRGEYSLTAEHQTVNLGDSSSNLVIHPTK